MSKLQKLLPKKEKGQILVIMALVFIGLIAIVGLSIDLGYMFISYSRLRRSVDAAALAATGEFKKGYTIPGLTAAANQILSLNQVQNIRDIQVDACNYTLVPPQPAADTEVCTDPPRKVVRVRASADVPLYFLSVVGLHSIPISAEAISEAASVDVVLTLDASESMTFEQSGEMSDPKVCNESDLKGGADGFSGDCQPFQQVREAAKLFVQQLYFPFDRVAIVTFDQYARAINYGTDADPRYFSRNGQAGETVDEIYYALQYYRAYDGSYIKPGTGYVNTDIDKANSVIVIQPELCPYDSSNLPSEPPPGSPNGTCRLQDIAGAFVGLDCPLFYGLTPTSAYCGSTNIEDGVQYAGAVLTDPANRRDEALWVMVLLSDGAANAAYDDFGAPICPYYTTPSCRDKDSSVRHDSSSNLYDPDDAARDIIDIVAGNGALIFSIGLGPARAQYSDLSAPPGETLLQYAAEEGFGVYYFAPDGAELANIFLQIANKIATRITQ